MLPARLTHISKDSKLQEWGSSQWNVWGEYNMQA